MPLSSRFLAASRVHSAPEARNVKTSCRPPGDQRTSPMPPSGSSVSARGSPPSRASSHSWVFLSFVRTKAIRLPSGDQRGETSLTSP